nr:hypothetical protein [Tanacetum cinerariifolium]
LGALTGEITSSMIGELTGLEVKIGDLDWTTGGWTSSMLPLLAMVLLGRVPELEVEALLVFINLEENQEVEFDLTSLKDDSWYFLGCN